MWVTSAPFWPARWFGSLLAWFVANSRRAHARLRRGGLGVRRHDARALSRSGSGVELREQTVRSRPTALALAAVVSSETPAGAPRETATISPNDIEQTVALLHDLRGLLVLDLTQVSSPPLEHCRVLATSWPSDPAAPTHRRRLVILVKFEHWVLLRTVLTAELELLATKGVEALLCYEEQHWDDWCLEGRIVHNVERVLRTLSALVERQRSESTGALPASHWKILLATTASILDGSSPDELCELTRIALGCGANEEALDLANEAVRYARKGSLLACRALRLLGVAMMRQGLGSGAHALRDALDLAVAIGANLEAAAVLNELGLHYLSRGERDEAESQLQAAVALCPDEHAELWAPLRNGLAENPPN